MKNMLRCMLTLGLFSCTSLPPEFFHQTIDLEIYGLYEVHPTTGLLGLGYIHYQRNNKDKQLLPGEKEDIQTVPPIYRGIPSFNYHRATIP